VMTLTAPCSSSAADAPLPQGCSSDEASRCSSCRCDGRDAGNRLALLCGCRSSRLWPPLSAASPTRRHSGAPADFDDVDPSKDIPPPPQVGRVRSTASCSQFQFRSESVGNPAPQNTCELKGVMQRRLIVPPAILRLPAALWRCSRVAPTAKAVFCAGDGGQRMERRPRKRAVPAVGGTTNCFYREAGSLLHCFLRLCDCWVERCKPMVVFGLGTVGSARVCVRYRRAWASPSSFSVLRPGC